MKVNQQLLEDIKRIIGGTISLMELDLMNPDQFLTSELPLMKDDLKEAKRVLKRLGEK